MAAWIRDVNGITSRIGITIPELRVADNSFEWIWLHDDGMHFEVPGTSADANPAPPFYGGPPAPEDIPKIKAAILVHHGELDTRLAATWPAYDKALSAAKVPSAIVEGKLFTARMRPSTGVVGTLPVNNSLFGIEF